MLAGSQFALTAITGGAYVKHISFTSSSSQS